MQHFLNEFKLFLTHILTLSFFHSVDLFINAALIVHAMKKLIRFCDLNIDSTLDMY